MLKYVEVQVGFSEVPEEIALCINISGCPYKCKGCHSPHLWKDIGEELTVEVLERLIGKNPGITCISFMGGDANYMDIVSLAKWVKTETKLKVCWYSGTKEPSDNILPYKYFDYIKIGPYVEELGGLDSPTTNQRFYEVKCEIENGLPFTHFTDITFKFQKQ